MTIFGEAAPPQTLTIEEYLAMEERPAAHLYGRMDAGRWELLSIEGLDSEVFFNSLGFSLALRDVYHKTESL